MKERLKQLRRERGLKQREVATLLGVSTPQISAWEKGRDEIPKVRVEQICNKFGVNQEWFETGAGEKEHRPTKEEQFYELAKEFYESLDPRWQRLFQRIVREKLSVPKTQANWGNIGGDMIQY